jgi:hypothetical protein
MKDENLDGPTFFNPLLEVAYITCPFTIAHQPTSPHGVQINHTHIHAPSVFKVLNQDRKALFAISYIKIRCFKLYFTLWNYIQELSTRIFWCDSLCLSLDEEFYYYIWHIHIYLLPLTFVYTLMHSMCNEIIYRGDCQWWTT